MANENLMFHAACVACGENWTYELADDIASSIENHDCGNDLSDWMA